jgi:hypothetical protein
MDALASSCASNRISVSRVASSTRGTSATGKYRGNCRTGRRASVFVSVMVVLLLAASARGSTTIKPQRVEQTPEITEGGE